MNASLVMFGSRQITHGGCLVVRYDTAGCYERGEAKAVLSHPPVATANVEASRPTAAVSTQTRSSVEVEHG